MNLTILDFEDKKSQAGKRYTRFNTENGWMSAFELDIIEKLKKLEGKKVCIGVAIDQEKGFKNIREFFGEAEAEADEEPEVIRPGEKKTLTEKPKRDSTTMYVSYCKDIFNVITQDSDRHGKTYAEDMAQAISLVKQAQKEFI